MLVILVVVECLQLNFLFSRLDVDLLLGDFSDLGQGVVVVLGVEGYVGLVSLRSTGGRVVDGSWGGKVLVLVLVLVAEGVGVWDWDKVSVGVIDVLGGSGREVVGGNGVVLELLLELVHSLSSALFSSALELFNEDG